MFRRIWLSSAIALMSAGAAMAADMPTYEPVAPATVPSFSWSGAYVGVQAGYAWMETDNRLNGVAPDTKPNGFTVGGYVGYNHQLDNSPLVLGVEADLAYSDAKDSSPTGGFGAAGRIRNEIGWTGALRGRVGYAFDRFLVYGAGGLAIADHEIKARGPISGSDDTVAVGWTIGGGVEAAITDNVSARVEYRYSDYGTDSFSVAGSRVKGDVTDNRVMMGLGYKFSTGW